MTVEACDLIETMVGGNTLAVADQVLINPKPGTLLSRTGGLLSKIRDPGVPGDAACRTLIRLGMNFVGRDTEIVGYNRTETEAALGQVLATIDHTESVQAAMPGIVQEFLDDMLSVNKADSLSGLLAERIQAALKPENPGRSFLELMRRELRAGVYYRMIGEGYCKFGNDYARGLEYLRHFGFCQVSTNPVLAAIAFDEDEGLAEALKKEVALHDDWMSSPEEHADEIAMAATLIALWPNLAIFRPLALYTGLKDYMVSFQLNPNIADQADPSVEDARNAHGVAAEFLKDYDRLLGLGEKSGEVAPNIVFKVAASHDASRTITEVLNSEGIGTNNTVVYTVAQEIQLIIDAFKGKAEALNQERQVVRTYETNMGGRFVSHLREVEAEKLFLELAEESGDDRATTLLDQLADSLGVDDETRAAASGSVADKARAYCAYKFLKAIDHDILKEAAKNLGKPPESLGQLEEDLKKGGTLVARRVYGVFFTEENVEKWIDYLQRTYGLTPIQAEEVVESMDVLPASKRIPEDSYHTLGTTNMCNTEFPNHSRAVQLASEAEGFRLEDYKDAVLASYDPAVAERLRALPDFVLGYDLTPSLKTFLTEEVRIDVDGWQTGGIEPEQWPAFGSVQKTSGEFRAAYDTFAAHCVEIAKEAS